jgi:4-amino-4-deoxy-L-arabinose transferase-like glycosyltransferase
LTLVTSIRPSIQTSAFRLQHFALLFLAVCPYLINLGVSAIWDANEAFYVETPREMIERADYVMPMFNYEQRVNKPVLSYWIVAGFYKVFGVSVGVQRIPIAIGGIVLIAAAFFLARAAAPPGLAAAAGWWAALGLAISPRLLMFARRIFIDIYISMFMALTLLFFALSERYPQRRRLFLALMYVAVGLGVLTKGPIAIVLPGLVFAVYLVVHRELARVRAMMLPLGTAIVSAIVLPWYVALYRVAGWEPIEGFIWGENVRRWAEGYGVSADRPFWWYIPVVFSDSFPWSILLVPAAIVWFQSRRQQMTADDGSQRIRNLLWLWTIVIVGFFSLSVAKQDLYIFPIVPAVAALAGVVIAQGIRASSGAPGIRAAIVVMGIVLMIAGAGFYALFYGPQSAYMLAGALPIGAVAVVGGAAAAMLASRQRAAAALLTIAAALVAINWVFVLRVLPSFEVYKPAPAMAADLKTRAGPEDLIVTYNVALPSLVYYLQRHIVVHYDHGPVLGLLRENKPMYLLVTVDDYERAIEPVTAGSLCRISLYPTFEMKLRNVLARGPRPEILLMTNKCTNRD